MCVIVIREPNVKLDYSKFKTLVMNNPHGWGISVPDGEGSLFTYREVDSNTDTDPERLYEYIHSEFKDSKFMLHLRYTTAGETVLRNAHPFPILEKGPDGIDMRMAHNGTLNAYEPKWNAENKWESDTRVFTRTFLRPLMKRFIIGRSSEEVLKDRFTHDLIDSNLTAMSVVTLMDGNGNTLLVNEKGNGGFTDSDGTYYSNKYSFDEDHRKQKGWGVVSSSTGKTSRSTQPTNMNSGNNSNGTTQTVFTSTPKFTDKYDIKDTEDLFNLSDETIDLLVEDEPKDAVLLIKELLYCLKKSTDKHQRASRLLASKVKLIQKLQNEDKEYGKAA